MYQDSVSFLVQLPSMALIAPSWWPPFLTVPVFLRTFQDHQGISQSRVSLQNITRETPFPCDVTNQETTELTELTLSLSTSWTFNHSLNGILLDSPFTIIQTIQGLSKQRKKPDTLWFYVYIYICHCAVLQILSGRHQRNCRFPTPGSSSGISCCRPPAKSNIAEAVLILVLHFH